MDVFPRTEWAHVVKARCLIGGAFIHLKMFEVHFDCAGSQKLLGPSGCFPRLRSRCGAARIFGLGGHFSWHAQEKPRVLVVQCQLSWQAQGIGVALLRCADCVAVAALWTWRWSSARYDFAAGVAKQDFEHLQSCTHTLTARITWKHETHC